MSEMSEKINEKYLKDANDHADFLIEKVFRPTFIMAFLHGVKHGREDTEIKLTISKAKQNEIDMLDNDMIESLRKVKSTRKRKT